MSDARTLRQQVLAAVAERSGFWTSSRLATKLSAGLEVVADQVQVLSLHGQVQVVHHRLHITDDGRLIATRGKERPSPSSADTSHPIPSSDAPVDRASLFASAVQRSPGRPRSAYAEVLGWDVQEIYRSAKGAELLGLVDTTGIGIQTIYHPPAPAPEVPPMSTQPPSNTSWRETQAQTDATVVDAVAAQPHQRRSIYRKQLQLEDGVLLASLRRCRQRGDLVRTGKGTLATYRPPGSSDRSNETAAPQSTPDRVRQMATLLAASDGLSRADLATRLKWSRATTDRILGVLRGTGRLDSRGTSRRGRRWWLAAQAEEAPVDNVVQLPAPDPALLQLAPAADPGPPTRSYPAVCESCEAELRVLLTDDGPTTVGEHRPGCSRSALVVPESFPSEPPQPVPAPSPPPTTQDTPEPERPATTATEQLPAQLQRVLDDEIYGTATTRLEDALVRLAVAEVEVRLARFEVVELSRFLAARRPAPEGSA